MNRIFLGVALLAGGVGAVFCATVRRQDETIRPDTFIGPVAVGGMTAEDAEKALRIWWETAKLRRLKVEAPGLNIKLPEMKPGELGVTLDDVTSVKNALSAQSASPASQHFEPTFRTNGLSLKPLEAMLGKAAGAGHPARVRYEHGSIVRIPGTVGAELDEAALPDRVGRVFLVDRPEGAPPSGASRVPDLDKAAAGIVVLPLKTGAGNIPPEALNAITDVVSSFSTRFPTYKRTRCSNIKLAAHLIDGTVLLPGERFSFNDVVGRRTLKAGFKVAGVYINGQHDTGVGGGICQVSTTLYNAALLSNLAIHRRSNHSLPVPYVPLGRDATVDYGNLDLVFENTYPTPIAVSSEYKPGELTFRILGKKPEGMSVKIIRGPMKWADEDVEQVQDPHLLVGKHRVLKPGSAHRSVSTVRVVYIDGKVVKREPLGRSHYGGQTRVVAIGTKSPDVSNPVAPPANGPSARAVPVSVPPPGTKGG